MISTTLRPETAVNLNGALALKPFEKLSGRLQVHRIVCLFFFPLFFVLCKLWYHILIVCLFSALWTTAAEVFSFKTKFTLEQVSVKRNGLSVDFIPCRIDLRNV